MNALPPEALLKRVTPIFAVTLLLGASALWFVSCASEQVNNPLPPVTVLKSEPASATDSNELAPAILTSQQEAGRHSSKPLTTSPIVQPIPAAAAVIMVSPTPLFKTANPLWDSNWWPWLLLLIALLVLLKATEPLRARYQNKKKITPEEADELALAKKTGLTDDGIFVQGAGTAPAVVLAKKAHWIPVMALSKAEKEIAVTAFYQGIEHKMHFSPATTVKKVTAWAAYQCGIFDPNSTEVYLAIRGYSAPLTGTAHIGRFMMREKHHLELDVLTFSKNAPTVPKAALAENSELSKDEILVEGAGMTRAVRVSIKPETPLKEIIGSVARIGNFPPQNAFIFLENESNPLNPNLPPDNQHPRDKVHHVHTQMEITVTAFFNGKERRTRFSPATTISKVSAWAAYQFEVFDQDAAEVYLSIRGYSAPLTGSAHIGRFVEHDKNNLELDLLTFTKVTTKV